MCARREARDGRKSVARYRKIDGALKRAAIVKAGGMGGRGLRLVDLGGGNRLSIRLRVGQLAFAIERAARREGLSFARTRRLAGGSAAACTWRQIEHPS